MRALLLGVVILNSLLAFTRCFRTVCFYYSTKPYKVNTGMLEPDNLDTRQCTHLVYSHAVVNGLNVVPAYDTDEESWWGAGTYKRFVSQRSANSSVKFLLALGHVNLGPASLATVVQTEANMKIFGGKLADFIDQRQFDGVHLEWSNFAAKSYASYDKLKFSRLAGAIRAAFTAKSNQTKTSLILTISLPAIKRQIDQGFLIADIARSVDFITIRTLDMRTDRDKKVGLSSALFSNTLASGDDRFLSVDWNVGYYESKGVPLNKINFAIPTYGRTFTLANEAQHHIGAASIGPGEAGDTTAIYGILSFVELCRLFRVLGRIYDVPSQHGRYYVVGRQWISYDDIYSVVQKVCYAKKKGIGGLSFWSLEVDDFSGECGRGIHPLITTAVNAYMASDMSLCAPLDPHIFVDVPSSPGATTPPVPPDVRKALTRRVVCYFINTAYFRRGKGQFLPESINPHICTHIVYAYAKITNNTIYPLLDQDDSQNWRRGWYLRVIDHRRYNPNLKILLGIGGYNLGPSGFENVSKNAETMKLFTTHAVAFLHDRKFDGLEVDWQYLKPEYKKNNVLLLQALRSAFDEDAIVTGKPRLLLSTTLPGSKKRLDEGYRGEVNTLVKHVDFISVLTYDFHGSWDVATSFNSPLYAHPDERDEATYNNLNYIVRYCVSLGVPTNLINIGIATYGRSFTLRHAKYNFEGAPVMGAGQPGAYTKFPGILSYYEICDLFALGATIVPVHSQRVNYAVKDYQWVGYDDVESVTEKACYALMGGYGGVVIWSLDYDDFNGDSCQEGRFPLTNAAFKVMQNQDFIMCGSFDPTKSISGADQLLGGSLLQFSSLLLLWQVAGCSLE